MSAQQNIHGVEWQGSEIEDCFKGEALGGLTVAEVRYAAEGEAEGGLGALMRAQAEGAGLQQPALSPAGWYWSVAVHGKWTTPKWEKTAQAGCTAASRYFAINDTRGCLA